eukprot:10227797-Lingulodinium_polyedra.AAC.1
MQTTTNKRPTDKRYQTQRARNSQTKAKRARASSPSKDIARVRDKQARATLDKRQQQFCLPLATPISCLRVGLVG